MISAFGPHQKNSFPKPPAQLPVGGFGAAGLLVTAGALVSTPLPGLVISGAGTGAVEGAGGVVAGGGISGSAEVDGVLVLVFPAPEGGVGLMPLLEPDG